MESKYNQKAWEQETELGRRLYIHNFGMKGTEFAGWELIKTDEKKLTATRQKPLKVKTRENEKTVLIDTLPEPTPSSGWTRVLASGGEIRKEGDTLYLVDEQGGDRTVEIINYKLV